MDISLFEKVSDKHLLVIGDVMLDEYVEGTIERKSPEAPVPILSVKGEYSRLGGAANVALNIKALDCKVSLLGVVGSDYAGNTIKHLLNKEGIPAYLFIDNRRKTTVKKRVLGPDGHLLRIDTEDTYDITKEAEVSLIDKISSINDITGIIISDYDKGVMTSSFVKNVLSLAFNRGIPVYVDPKHNRYWEYKGVRIFKPNFKELKFASATETLEVENLMKESQKKLIVDFLVCTMSEKGIAYVNDEEIKIIPTKTKSIIDVSGAGDTVMAIMALGDQCGMDILDICELANIGGGIVCQYPGVVTISYQNLLNATVKS